MDQRLDELSIPPDSRVILQVLVVNRDASSLVDAQGLARAYQLLSPRLTNPVVIPWIIVSKLA